MKYAQIIGNVYNSYYATKNIRNFMHQIELLTNNTVCAGLTYINYKNYQNCDDLMKHCEDNLNIAKYNEYYKLKETSRRHAKRAMN